MVHLRTKARESNIDSDRDYVRLFFELLFSVRARRRELHGQIIIARKWRQPCTAEWS